MFESYESSITIIGLIHGHIEFHFVYPKGLKDIEEDIENVCKL